MITDKGFAERWAARGDDRWGIVRQVYADWRTPLCAEDGISAERVTAAEERLGVHLPAALREWYEMAGARDDLRGRGNHLLTPERLRIDQDAGMLVFYQENQYVCRWGLRLEESDRSDDPAAYVAERGNEDWIAQDPTLSQFVLQMTLLETQFAAPFTANAAAPPKLIEEIGRLFEDLGLSWWHWPRYPGRRFAGPGVLVGTDGPGAAGEAWLWLAAKTAAIRDGAMRDLDRALRRLTERPGARSSVRRPIDWLVQDEGRTS